MNLFKLKEKLFAKTPIFSLVFTRIVFGLVAFRECYVQMSRDVISNYYLPKFHFKYYGFSWVEPLTAPWIHWFFCLMLAFSVFVIIGIFYRISIVLLVLGLTYIFLLDQAFYLNYFYMMILFGTLLTVMPAHRYFSFDAHFFPQIKTEEIPFWPIFLLRCQLEIILIFAGIVKINYDWIYNLMPLKMWFASANTSELLHHFLTQDWVVRIACYGAITLHLAGAPMLLFKRTRIYALAIYFCFHLINHFVFNVGSDYILNIGSFPWMTLAFTLIFFEADWPKKIFKFFDKSQVTNVLQKTAEIRKSLLISMIAVWIILQILIPLRYLLYPGIVSWTREGQRFAWRMKLNDVKCDIGFDVADIDTNEKYLIKISDHVTYPQYMAMAHYSDMALQFAHYLRDTWIKETRERNIKVTAKSSCSLNDRTPATFIDPSVDLTKVERNLRPANWIMPFELKSK